MKLSISNLAWAVEDSPAVYAYLREKGFDGVEIAPTVLFPQAPYDHPDEAAAYAARLKEAYGLEISSMQSIWFGQSGNIFASEEDRQRLEAYTLRAIAFAAAIGCRNLVFGNPKARSMGEGHRPEEVYGFFRRISDAAAERGCRIALEPNPVIYGTDFINTTEEAFAFCEAADCPALRVNVDFGTILYNGESLEPVVEHLGLVHHIHISEPYLKKIERRSLHRRLRTLPFDGYVSVEMGRQAALSDVFEVIDYVAEVFDR